VREHAADNLNLDRLRNQHENIEGILQHLWERARVGICGGDIDSVLDSEDPAPPDEFTIGGEVEQTDAARAYIDLRENLRDYYRYEGRWRNWRDTARRAYAMACALERWQDVAWEACEVAWGLAQEGRYRFEDLEKADRWIACIEEVNERERFVGEWPALAASMRGQVALRRGDYAESERHLRAALQEYQRKSEYHEDVPRMCDLQAKLKMRYGPGAKVSYETPLRHIEEGIKAAEVNGEEEYGAILALRKAELLAWWGVWEEADLLLADILSTAKELEQKEIEVRALYLDAFVWQHKSATAGDGGQAQLDQAVDRITQSLKLLRDTYVPDVCLQIYSSCLVLAALYLSRADITEDSHDRKRADENLDEARELIDARKRFGLDVDPDCRYEEACLEAIQGNIGRAGECLRAAIDVQPGSYIRATNDFRLDALLRDETNWAAVEAHVKGTGDVSEQAQDEN
jgi:hypothetical protein